MTLLRSIAMAFSLFSRIPMPHIDWKPASMRYMMAAFPLIGLAIGLLIWGWVALCAALGLNAIVLSAGITLIPLLVTGGIHLDGFCDVVDAQSSHAEPQRKREILKDPHIGAFAAIGVVCYVLAYFACATQLDFGIASSGFAMENLLPASLFSPAGTGMRVIVMLCIIQVLTRTGSGIATTAFAKASENGMLAMEHDSAHAKPVIVALGIIAALCMGCAFVCWPQAAIVVALVWAVSLPVLNLFAKRQFGGMSGDIAGFYLQTCELALVALLALVQLIG